MVPDYVFVNIALSAVVTTSFLRTFLYRENK